jgi:hypothetical protein
MMSVVPTKSGTAPNAPEDPTWSARMAVCGLQCRPNRNSHQGDRAKKRTVSNSTENTIPTVVSTATIEHVSRIVLTILSTEFRARNNGVSRRIAQK